MIGSVAELEQVPNAFSAAGRTLAKNVPALHRPKTLTMPSFMVVFFANACGVELSFGMLAVVLLSNALLSIYPVGPPPPWAGHPCFV